MIIAARIFLNDAEFAELKANGKLSPETAQVVLERTRRAIKNNSFDTITYVVDHGTNAEVELVDAGEIEARLDDER